MPIKCFTRTENSLSKGMQNEYFGNRNFYKLVPLLITPYHFLLDMNDVMKKTKNNPKQNKTKTKYIVRIHKISV